ncbi:hypothetical protein Sgleb_07990 [Streptomyces glebosus]|uniref:Uncharacterized protein n=1 Tax=Streptomyces glebosus TaxID=249580 RepID=A0A640SPN1_9ACTN|nr:hypothetical protein Sgleb_07990 [Streptomyces glebosus]GHG74784.1 hypothetical protein GCM10010513_48870 [Streptomyces glebosus]
MLHGKAKEKREGGEEARPATTNYGAPAERRKAPEGAGAKPHNGPAGSETGHNAAGPEYETAGSRTANPQETGISTLVRATASGTTMPQRHHCISAGNASMTALHQQQKRPPPRRHTAEATRSRSM